MFPTLTVEGQVNPVWQARYEIVRNSLRYRYQQYLGHNENLEENSLWNIEIVNYGPLYCIATTCHRIGKIVNETSYRVAKSSQSFTESSCLVAESSCHRIGQLTNRPVPETLNDTIRYDRIVHPNCYLCP